MSESAWPTESEAALTLATSVKSIQRYAAKGLIEIRKRPRVGRKPENICNPQDVAKLFPAAHIMPPEPVANGSAPEGIVRRPHVQPAPDFMTIIQTIATAMEAGREIVQTRAPKLWMTLKEAVEYSGLARADLERLCRMADEGRGQVLAEAVALERGDLPRHTLIVRKSNGWKILRKSLEAFEG
jgi:hypothetical protein